MITALIATGACLVGVLVGTQVTYRSLGYGGEPIFGGPWQALTMWLRNR